MQQLGQLKREEEAESIAYFATTCWTTVRAAAQPAGDRGEALQELCKIYWQPVFVFLLRRGYSTQDAEDLTQDFFVGLLSNDLLGRADRDRGRFRAFLLTALNNFLADARIRAQAHKRGGKYQFISLEKLLAGEDEERWAEPQDRTTPETAFDVQWAQVLVRHSLGRLRQEMTAQGKEAHFIALQPFLTNRGELSAQENVANQLGMTLAGLRTALSRMRKHYQRCLHAEIARTVDTPEEIEEERRHLAAVLLPGSA